MLKSHSGAAEFVNRFSHLLDHFQSFPGYPGIPEELVDYSIYQTFLNAQHRQSLDLIIQMHGNETFVNDFVLDLNPQFAAGL